LPDQEGKMDRKTLRRVALVIGMLTPTLAAAQDKTVKLFKVVSPKDETVVGVTETELRSYGPDGDIDNLTKRIASAGQLTLWQYVARKGNDGELRLHPAQRIGIFAAGTVRIEPYKAALPVIPPE
jgi:hypothetical protein